MKKKILALLITLAVLIGTMGGMSAFAAVSLEECDKCFQTTMNSLLDSADVDGNTITAERKPVYDILLEQLGYVYEFALAEGEGYAVIICDDGNYVAQEVMPHAQSPYAEVAENELCVFVNNMSYYKAVEGKICAISTGEEISAEAFDFLKENAVFYKGGDNEDSETVMVHIKYTDREMTPFGMSYKTPTFLGTDVQGGCAAVAGGNLIGYFDRYYEDLIPNHVAGKFILNELYKYNDADTYVHQAIKKLYEYMEGTEEGIKEENFKKGLQKYCTEKGLTCDFTSLMSWGKLNYNSVKSSMHNNKPVALLLNNFNLCIFHMLEDSKEHYLEYRNYFANHVMVGFGYRDITYTLEDNSKTSYSFIYVASGMGASGEAYFNINYSTNIISAYGVNIH